MVVFFFLFHPLDLSLASFDSLFWREVFFFGLVTILFKGIKALRLEINLMLPSSGHGSDQSTLKNRTRILRGPPIKDDE